MNYNYITNPINNRKVSLSSKRGKEILKNYINMYGGSSIPNRMPQENPWEGEIMGPHAAGVALPSLYAQREIAKVEEREAYRLAQRSLYGPDVAAFAAGEEHRRAVGRLNRATNAYRRMELAAEARDEEEEEEVDEVEEEEIRARREELFEKARMEYASGPGPAKAAKEEERRALRPELYPQ
jgi:hypothetical protein